MSLSDPYQYLPDPVRLRIYHVPTFLSGVVFQPLGACQISEATPPVSGGFGTLMAQQPSSIVVAPTIKPPLSEVQQFPDFTVESPTNESPPIESLLTAWIGPPDNPMFSIKYNKDVWKPGPGGLMHRDGHLVHNSIPGCEFGYNEGFGLEGTNSSEETIKIGDKYIKVYTIFRVGESNPVLRIYSMDGEYQNGFLLHMRNVQDHYDQCIRDGDAVINLLESNTLVQNYSTTVPEYSPQNSNDSGNCPGVYGNRLRVGDTARVIVFQVSIRDKPGGSGYGSKIDVLAKKKTMKILEGPLCVNGLFFVRMRSEKGSEGWIAEGDSENYYLEPVK